MLYAKRLAKNNLRNGCVNQNLCPAPSLAKLPMLMSHPPNLKEIACAAGVSASSVSRALKGHPSIPKSTQNRIKKIADAMGWRPDPRLSQLMTYMRKDKTTRSTCNLGWLNTWNKPGEWDKPWNCDYLIGARQRASEMGYALDEIDATSLKRRPRSINRILKSRGIEGLVLPQFWADHPVAQSLEWESYATVFVDNFSPDLAGARVASNSHANAQLLLRRLHELGYRRPALWISEFVDDNTGHAYSAHLPWAQKRWFLKPHSPVTFSMSNEGLHEFLKKHQPDVLIVQSNSVLPELQRLGYRIPEDIGLVHHNLAEDVTDWAGIDQRHLEIGAAAVDSLVAQLQRHELGVSRSGKQVFILGQWRDGFTVRQQEKK